MAAFGMPVGPFTLLDTIGLDIAANVAQILYQNYGPRMAPAALLNLLVKEGRTGVKAGRGFYVYPNGSPASEDADLHRLLAVVQRNGGRRDLPWVRSRLLLAMVNEAVTALQEGVASARDIDTAMIAGISAFHLIRRGRCTLPTGSGSTTCSTDWKSSRTRWARDSGRLRCFAAWWQPASPATLPDGVSSPINSEHRGHPHSGFAAARRTTWRQRPAPI